MAQQSTSNPGTHLLRTLSDQMADAVERINPALVLVNGRQRQPGSGIVYAPDLVLTANHVLEREDNLTIETHDGRTLAAQFAGRDPATDLAALRVEGLGIEAATAAEHEARVGQLTIAVGRAAHDGPMASSGIVSAVGGPLRTGRGVALERYIRTDATPYPGFSGGPLIDVQGSVLGILTTGIVEGIALAIPMQLARNIADTLTSQGYVKRGYLGISSQLVDLPAGQRAGRTQEHGLLIVKVDDDSPAQRAGLILGDILLTLDGQPTNDAEALQLLLVGDRVGKNVPLEVMRGNILQTLQVTIGERK